MSFIVQHVPLGLPEETLKHFMRDKQKNVTALER